MRMFGANIFLLIGILLALAILIFLLLGGWVTVKILIFRRAQHRAEQKRNQEKFRADGSPYPPASRGICHTCGKAYPKVYHMPDGTKLCPLHYEEQAP